MHWKVLTAHGSRFGHGWLVVGQRAAALVDESQSDCAVGVLVLVTGWPAASVSHWKQVACRSCVCWVVPHVCEHGVHWPVASQVNILHGATGAHGMVRDTQVEPHNCGGTEAPELEVHLAWMLLLPAVPHVIVGHAVGWLYVHEYVTQTATEHGFCCKLHGTPQVPAAVEGGLETPSMTKTRWQVEIIVCIPVVTVLPCW